MQSSIVYSGQYPRLSRGRPGFNSPSGRNYFSDSILPFFITAINISLSGKISFWQSHQDYQKLSFIRITKKLYNLISYCLLSFCVRKFFSSVTCLSTFPSQLSLTTYAESYRENKLVYPFFFCNQNLSNYFCFACLEQPQRKLLDFEKCVCLAVSRTCCVLILKLTYYPSHE